ncbi:MAG: hypothetical protein K6G11_04350 [Lachnospiraceae bacterium]|nr:hypothetical protein [Lachnospiraceae bacterium]
MFEICLFCVDIDKTKVKKIGRKVIGLLVSSSLVIGITGCSASDARDEVTGEEEYLIASGKGRDVADVPLIIAADELSDNINPFGELTKSDKLAVELVCGSLVTFDRENMLVKYAVDGEKRKYEGNDYTYTGMADINYRYDEKKDSTTYTITIGDDVCFSDGTSVTTDDLLFSLFAFSDESYKGPFSLNNPDNLDKIGHYILSLSDFETIVQDYNVLNSKTMEVKVSGFNISYIKLFDFPVCSLDYYGDRSKFDIDKKQYGFDKGDISSLIEGKGLMGLGAYKLVKYGDDTIYFDANEKYFKGCPKTAFVQLKESNDADSSTLLTEISEGVYNSGEFDDGKAVYDYTMSTNDNGEVNGSKYYANFIDGDTFQTICLNASVLNVNDRPDTDRSKALRQAFCYLFASNRADLIQRYYGTSAEVINYPFAASLWVVPDVDDEDYREAYAYTNPVKGDPIYTKDMDVLERGNKAMEMAIECFKKAGYSYEDGKLIPDKDLKNMDYRIYVPLESEDYSCLYSYLKVISRDLAEVGIDLQVYFKHQDVLDKKVENRKACMWVQEFDNKSDDTEGVLFDLYYNNYSTDINALGVDDANLAEYIDNVESETTYKKKEKAYKNCYKIISEWGVIVPMFQHKRSYIFKSSQINSKTVADNMTPYYGWIDEIEKVETT